MGYPFFICLKEETTDYEMICLVLAGPRGNKKSNQVVCQFTFAVKDNESNFLTKQTFVPACNE